MPVAPGRRGSFTRTQLRDPDRIEQRSTCPLRCPTTARMGTSAAARGPEVIECGDDGLCDMSGLFSSATPSELVRDQREWLVPNGFQRMGTKNLSATSRTTPTSIANGSRYALSGLTYD